MTERRAIALRVTIVPTRDEMTSLRVVEALKQDGPYAAERQLAALFPGHQELKLRQCNGSDTWMFMFDDDAHTGVLVAAEDKHGTVYDRVALVGDSSTYWASFVTRESIPFCLLNLTHTPETPDDSIVLSGHLFYDAKDKVPPRKGQEYMWVRAE
jgi:hypothetical protein